MKIIIYGTTFLCVAFFLHLFIWKICMPKRQIAALLGLFSGTLFAGFIVLGMVRQSLTAVEYIYIALFFLSLTVAYISAYSAIEADSPTLAIIMPIAKAGLRGLTKDELLAMVTNESLVKPRVDDLLGAKMAYLDGNKFRLTAWGKLFGQVFIFYRKLLKTYKGG